MYTKEVDTVVTVGDLLIFKGLVKRSQADDEIAKITLKKIKQLIKSK
ncbi:hypothetical protein SAMN04487909_12817 [Aneurinibacillus migulanus]|uniref:Uncharacterized protein n=1 Tax=Aneurinibacillus migulanus TaxID=47500 RepID=A0A1G8WF98_ANEMI|nr:hypothetical protein AMI01nite_28760 [Aneurinibacillus migulanus]SDJ76836.1 hypothetical protein SAMN04487909_12817 [Aneurinibacillus migulanus]